MVAQPKPMLTYAEYLELERTSEEKHDYLRGEVWAMAGGTPSHSKIAANIAAALSAQLKGGPCGVFNSDLRVRVVETDRSTHPDVTVVCGKRELAADDANAVINPTAIVEVLSDSTEASDRGEKFAHLQRLGSLQEYVLVNQRSKRIEVFRRGEGPSWTLTPYGDGQRVELRSIGATLDVSAMYDDPTA